MSIISKSIILLIFLAFMLALVSGFRFFQGEPTLQDNIEVMAEKWPKLKVLLDPQAPGFSVAEWKKAHMDMQVTALSKIQATILLPKLISELEKYPASLINSNIEAIAVVESLKLSSVYQISANVGQRVFLSAAVLSNPEQTVYLHQELNAVLLNNHHFPLMQWASQMPEYEKPSAMAAMLSQVDTESCNLPMSAKDKLRQVGLEKAAVENDIALLSGQLFSNPKRLKLGAEKNTTLNRKYKMLTAFYTGLEPAYTWNF